TLIDQNHLIPLEAAHLPYRKHTFEYYVGVRGMERFGKKEWRRDVADVCDVFMRTLLPDYIVLGGGNAKSIKDLPPNCRLGDNSLAFAGGFRVWDPEWSTSVPPLQTTGPLRMSDRRAS